MGKISIENILPGMLLEADVLDMNGNVLIGKGCELTERHLKILKMWGVLEADIAGVDREEMLAQEMAQLDPELLHSAEARMTDLFHHTDLTHPAIKELFRLATRRAMKLQQQGDHHA
jgi:hypothetical protein